MGLQGSEGKKMEKKYPKNLRNVPSNLSQISPHQNSLLDVNTVEFDAFDTGAKRDTRILSKPVNETVKHF